MRLGHDPAVQFGRRFLVESVMPVIRVTPEDERRAWDLFRQHQDKRFSFVDCTSFAVMKRIGMRTAFAFDDDFRQLGKWVVEPSVERS